MEIRTLIIVACRPKLPEQPRQLWRGPGVPTVSSGLGGPQTVPWPELAELEPLTSTHMQATHQTTDHRILPSVLRPCDVVILYLCTLRLSSLPCPPPCSWEGRNAPSQHEDEPVIIVAP